MRSFYGGKKDLASSPHDVGCMRTALISDFYFPEKDIRELIGTVSTDDFMEAVAAVGGDYFDVVLLFFSGHGCAEDGKHYLAFSDGRYPTETIVAHLSKLCRSLIVVLDCCFSGGVTLSAEESGLLGQTSGGGCILFASSSAAEYSYAGEGLAPSCFTSHFVQAAKLGYSSVTGLVSLPTVEKVLRNRMRAWNRCNPERAQNIVIRSNQHGSLYFPNPSYTPYLPAIPETFESEGCSVREVKPIHNAKRRYLVKALVGESASLEYIASCTPQVVEYARKLHVYGSKRQERLGAIPVSHVFVDFFSSSDDLAGENPKYRSIWVAEDEGRSYWYRNGEIVFEDYCVFKHSGWELQRLMRERNRIDEAECTTVVQALFDQIDAAGLRVFGIFDEYQNGTLTEDEMRELLDEVAPDVHALNDKVVDVGFPGGELENAVNLLIGMSGDLIDALLFYSSEVYLSRDSENRKECMTAVKNRYYDDYRRFVDVFCNLQLS